VRLSLVGGSRHHRAFFGLSKEAIEILAGEKGT
jgi:hypothetical protein